MPFREPDPLPTAELEGSGQALIVVWSHWVLEFPEPIIGSSGQQPCWINNTINVLVEAELIKTVC